MTFVSNRKLQELQNSRVVISIPVREMVNGNRGREIKIPAQNGKRREMLHLISIYLLTFIKIAFRAQKDLLYAL